VNTIRSPQLVAVIAAIQQREPDLVRSALRHLQRRRVLKAAGGGMGHGRASEYGPPEIVSLAVAFELMTAGVPPERTSVAIEEAGGAMLVAVAAVMANRARDHILLALDGSLTSCSPAILTQWAMGRGSTRSAVVVNMRRLVDDLRDAVADTMGRDAAALLDALDTWAGTIMMTPGNASDPDPL
jgi:hypothetical protein